jgi:GntR family transcriptional regulator
MDRARETEASTPGEVGGQLEVRRYAPVVATAEVADRLGLQEGARVLARGFRFIVEGRPAQLADSYIPYDLVKGTPVEDPNNEPRPGATFPPSVCVASCSSPPELVLQKFGLRPPADVEPGAAS